MIKGIHVYSNEGSYLFPRGDNYEIANILFKKLKIFLITTGPLSIKLGTKHSWGTGIQICLNEEPRPFQRGDNYQIVKIH